MRPTPFRISWLALGLMAVAAPARAQYRQSILAVDPSNAGLPGVNASTVIDPNLLDPWGLSFSKTSAFWISDQASSVKNADGTTVSAVSTLLAVNPSGVPSPVPLIVNVPNLNNAPPSGDVRNGPTGQVSTGAVGITTNPATDFQVNVGGRSGEANFIFANLDGSISAWRGGLSGTLATIQTSVPNASFTGLAIGNASGAFGASGAGAYLYAADQDHTSVDVFNAQWQLVGHLTNPNGLPAGFTPFNVQNLNGVLFVTYADSTGGTGGLVDEFRTDGTFLRTLIDDPTGKWLDQPWGIAQAPGDFGVLSNALLVGNNDGNFWINAFDANSGSSLGPLMLGPGTPFSADGLWALVFGNGGTGSNGPANTLFFTAGPGDATGIFGSITAVPEPASLTMLGLGGVAAIGFRRLGRRRS